MRNVGRIFIMVLFLSITQWVWATLPVLECKQTPAIMPEQTALQAFQSRMLAWLIANRRDIAYAFTPAANTDEDRLTPVTPQRLPGGNPNKVWDFRRLSGDEEGIMLNIPANQLPKNIKLPAVPPSVLFAKYDPLNQMGQVTLFKVFSNGGKIITIKAIQLTPQHGSHAGPQADAMFYQYYDSVWAGGASCNTPQAVTRYWPVGAAVAPSAKLAAVNSGANPCLLPQGFKDYDRGDSDFHVTEGGFRTLVTFLARQHNIHAHTIVYVIANPKPGSEEKCDGGIFIKKCDIHNWVDLVPVWWEASPYLDGLGISNSGNMVIPGITGDPNSRMVWVPASAGNNLDSTSVRVYDHHQTMSGFGFLAVFIAAVVMCVLAVATMGAALAALAPALGLTAGLGAAVGAAIGAAVGTVGAFLTMQGANGMSTTFLPYADGSQSASAPSLQGEMAIAQQNSPGNWTNIPAVNTPGGTGTVARQIDLRRLVQCVSTNGADCSNNSDQVIQKGDPRYDEAVRKTFDLPGRRLIDQQRLSPNPDVDANPFLGPGYNGAPGQTTATPMGQGQ
ncbi:MAG: hypothetical protein HQL09_09740 [Nitrospirae bacterium]|nr:hypothetical protein [Nitrospirota bacterium]